MNKYQKYYEELACRFHVITRVKVEDVLVFYTALGRFPVGKEIHAINVFGPSVVIESIQAGTPLMIHTTLGDLENLQSAKERFWYTFKNLFKKMLKKISLFK